MEVQRNMAEVAPQPQIFAWGAGTRVTGDWAGVKACGAGTATDLGTGVGYHVPGRFG
jgi:hypothetical protein